MKIRISTLRAVIREAISETLSETRPWGREVGAEWDEGPEGDRYDRAEYYKKKRADAAKKQAALRAHALATVPQPEKKNEGELDEKGSWLSNTLDKAKKIAMMDVGGPEGVLTPAGTVTRNTKTKGGPSDEFKKWQEKQSKKEVSETGAYYGKTAPAHGVPLGGNGQKASGLTSACGDPKCPGCEEDGSYDRDEPPVMCWCGDRDCSHYE